MSLFHGSRCDDKELLHQLVNQELQERGISVVLATPRPSKKGLAAFSTPANRGSDTPHNPKPSQGFVFGRRLPDLAKVLVPVGADQETNILVSGFVVSACRYIEDNIEIEGVYRMSGSQNRQKAIRAEIDDKYKDFEDLDPSPHVLDVASLLKQFLRELPEPVIPRLFHPLFASCHASSNPVENIQLALLLLPSDHISCLSFLLQHLHRVAESSHSNKMSISNLAIVFGPNLLPSQELPSRGGSNKERKGQQVDVNSAKLKLHTSILELLLCNTEIMGFLTSPIYERYQSCQSIQSHSEGEVLDDEGPSGAARRKTKKNKHERRRSGSLSRVLSVMGKAMGLGKTTPNKRENTSVHSTPLPNFGGTPAFPSPRGRAISNNYPKRNADGEHEQSPTKKLQRRTFESTFTPKMRKRSFSVKRFKRKKSETKMKPMSLKETLVIHTVDSITTDLPKQEEVTSPPRTRLSLITTPQMVAQREDDSAKTEFNNVLDEDYAEVKAQYEELKEEVDRLEAETLPNDVDERFNLALAKGNLARESRETTRQLAKVRRRSSEDSARKPRSPSLRKIGVIRRRSREREEKLARESLKDENEMPQSTSATRIGRSPTVSANRNSRSPTVKATLTPGITLGSRPSIRNGRLQRGQPNSTKVGLEKPLASPIRDEESGQGGRGRIKMSFKGRDRPIIRRDIPVKATRPPSREERRMKSGDSLTSLKNDISDLIEKSFGKGDKSTDVDLSLGCGMIDVFDGPESKVNTTDTKAEETDMVEKFENICFDNGGDLMDPAGITSTVNPNPTDMFTQSSPVTRSQLRRQSHSFQFTRPADVEAQNGENLRRQSSAFEFQTAEPTYENITRDVANRASMRRRNSSVKDLIQRLETSKFRPKLDAKREDFQTSESIPTHIRSKNSAEATEDSNRVKPVIICDPEFTGVQPEEWVDGAAFFKNIKDIKDADVPQCGRSSIVKIRKEFRGRVLDSVTKFSANTPASKPAASRRLSARLGVMGTPAVRLGHAPSPLATPLGLTNSSRRSTLTGIRTTTTSRNIGHYASPTLSSKARSKENLGDKSQLVEKHYSIDKSRPKKSPNTVVVAKVKKSPCSQPVYQNVRVERKTSNSRDIKRKSTNSSKSSSKERNNKSRVRRNKSTAEKSLRVVEKPEERRYLTIGYPGEVRTPNRSPLKETQNLLAVRPNNEQTPSRKVTNGTPCRKVTNGTPCRKVTNGMIITRRMWEEQENHLEAVTALVARKHSLRSDTIMSPHKVDMGSPLTRVKRAHSDRSSPRKSPYIRPDSLSVMPEGTPRRRSPRLAE